MWYKAEKNREIDYLATKPISHTPHSSVNMHDSLTWEWTVFLLSAFCVHLSQDLNWCQNYAYCMKSCKNISLGAFKDVK